MSREASADATKRNRPAVTSTPPQEAVDRHAEPSMPKRARLGSDTPQPARHNSQAPLPEPADSGDPEGKQPVHASAGDSQDATEAGIQEVGASHRRTLRTCMTNLTKARLVCRL